MDLKINNCDGTYEPREDSYMLARCVEKYAFGKTLDVGTGTGIQGITAALKGCEVTFLDMDDNALGCAKLNAKLNGVSGKFIKSDLLKEVKEKFNTIIFNPPYLPSKEKREKALDGGVRGRELIDRFLYTYKNNILEKHVVLLVESSFNDYEKDLKRLDAKIAAKEHYFFEDLVVLRFE